jgi:hypothetical protein
MIRLRSHVSYPVKPAATVTPPIGRWSPREDDLLRRLWMRGVELKDICFRLKRERAEIDSRLAHIGVLKARAR